MDAFTAKTHQQWENVLPSFLGCKDDVTQPQLIISSKSLTSTAAWNVTVCLAISVNSFSASRASQTGGITGALGQRIRCGTQNKGTVKKPFLSSGAPFKVHYKMETNTDPTCMQYILHAVIWASITSLLTFVS